MLRMVPEPHDWQLQCTELRHRGAHLLQSGLWSDCSFLVGSEVVLGHKLILSMASPVFEAMFNCTMVETSNKPIPITDIIPEAFKALLDYIYTDKLNFSGAGNACGLYYGAKKYMLPHLMKKCLRYIWSSLCLKNVCCVYEFAKLFEIHGLLKSCKQMIQNNASEVLKDSSFEEVELSTVLEVFSLERLRVSSELELFEAVERRARTSSEDDDQRIRSVLEKIRFLTLTPKQFVEGPAKSPLLTKDEVLSVLTNIASRDSHLPLPDGLSACREPRSLRAGPAEEMSILGMEEHCWRLILDYVPIRDIVRSERVSRGWQKMVLEYLSSIHIGIRSIWFRFWDIQNVRWFVMKIEEMENSSFELWCRKLGSSVVAACCASEQHLKTIPEQCPNLEAIMFYRLPETLLEKYTDVFKKLDHLLFINCDVSDSCVVKFAREDLKRLAICSNELMTGHCLLNIKSTKLQTLVLSQCEALKFSQLCSAVKRLRGLEELELQFVPEEINENLHLLLPNTPNLRKLIVGDYDYVYEHFPSGVCQLKRLKFLASSFHMTNADLEAVARSCKRLQVLLLSACHGVTGSGLRALCALAGARLSALAVIYCPHLTNDDVAACIRACPTLESLDVSGCSNLTGELLPLAAAARRDVVGASRPLNLYTCDISDELRKRNRSSSEKTQHEGLICQAGYLFEAMGLWE